ncbi:MAG: ArsR/SmtB family transcription factor [Pirellulaceae bacterium]
MTIMVPTDSGTRFMGTKTNTSNLPDAPSHRAEPHIVMPAEETIVQFVQLFKLLSDDTRLRILAFLHQTEELNVRQLCKLLRQRQPSVSHHLALLRTAGLLAMRRDGKHNFYRLIPARLEQLVRTYFGGSPEQTMRLCFDKFELRYVPIDSTP